MQCKGQRVPKGRLRRVTAGELRRNGRQAQEGVAARSSGVRPGIRAVANRAGELRLRRAAMRNSSKRRRPTDLLHGPLPEGARAPAKPQQLETGRNHAQSGYLPTGFDERGCASCPHNPANWGWILHVALDLARPSRAPAGAEHLPSFYRVFEIAPPDAMDRGSPGVAFRPR